MTLGVALFASVVLILLVYNKPFRDACGKIGIVLGVLFVIGAIVYGCYMVWDIHEQRVQKRAAEAQHKRDVNACLARYTAVGGVWTPPPDIWCEDHPDAIPVLTPPLAPGFTPFDPNEPMQPKPAPKVQPTIKPRVKEEPPIVIPQPTIKNERLRAFVNCPMSGQHYDTACRALVIADFKVWVQSIDKEKSVSADFELCRDKMLHNSVGATYPLGWDSWFGNQAIDKIEALNAKPVSIRLVLLDAEPLDTYPGATNIVRYYLHYYYDATEGK